MGVCLKLENRESTETEICTKSPGHAKTPRTPMPESRIIPKIRLGLASLGMSRSLGGMSGEVFVG